MAKSTTNPDALKSIQDMVDSVLKDFTDISIDANSIDIYDIYNDYNTKLNNYTDALNDYNQKYPGEIPLEQQLAADQDKYQVDRLKDLSDTANLKYLKCNLLKAKIAQASDATTSYKYDRLNNSLYKRMVADQKASAAKEADLDALEAELKVHTAKKKYYDSKDDSKNSKAEQAEIDKLNEPIKTAEDAVKTARDTTTKSQDAYNSSTNKAQSDEYNSKVTGEDALKISELNSEISNLKKELGIDAIDEAADAAKAAEDAEIDPDDLPPEDPDDYIDEFNDNTKFDDLIKNILSENIDFKSLIDQIKNIAFNNEIKAADLIQKRNERIKADENTQIELENTIKKAAEIEATRAAEGRGNKIIDEKIKEAEVRGDYKNTQDVCENIEETVKNNINQGGTEEKSSFLKEVNDGIADKIEATPDKIVDLKIAYSSTINGELSIDINIVPTNDDSATDVLQENVVKELNKITGIEIDASGNVIQSTPVDTTFGSVTDPDNIEADLPQKPFSTDSVIAFYVILWRCLKFPMWFCKITSEYMKSGQINKFTFRQILDSFSLSDIKVSAGEIAYAPIKYLKIVSTFLKGFEGVANIAGMLELVVSLTISFLDIWGDSRYIDRIVYGSFIANVIATWSTVNTIAMLAGGMALFMGISYFVPILGPFLLVAGLVLGAYTAKVVSTAA